MNAIHTVIGPDVTAGIFGTVRSLSTNAERTIVTVVGLIAVIFLIWKFLERRTIGALISAGIVAAILIWLVAGGIDTVKGWVETDLDSASSATQVIDWDA